MKKLTFLVCIISYLIIFSSCKTNPTTGSPKEVLVAFTEALSKKDFATAKSLTTKDGQMMIVMMETYGADKAKAQMDKFDQSKVKFGEAVINGDNAYVPITEKGSKESVDFPMKKVDGLWKVAFDLNSMMELGLKEMKKRGSNINDSLKMQLDKIKGMSMDSIMKGINKMAGDSM